MNARLHITLADYSNVAGPGWPSYNDFITNNYEIDDVINQEIDQFIVSAQQNIIPNAQFTSGPVTKKLKFYVLRYLYYRN